MVNGFAAILYRQSYINRWGLMRNARFESLAEHSLSCAYVAHILVCLATARFGAEADIEKTVMHALYHDASEIMTGDLPTPVKYSSEPMRNEYKKVEKLALERLCGMLPPDLVSCIRPSLTGEDLNDRERAIVKAADRLCAYIKCVEEERQGNTEFSSAKDTTLESIMKNPLPETLCFLAECMPAFSMTLDQLMSLHPGNQGDKNG